MLKLRSTDTLAYVCTFDPSVDLEKANLDKYRETLDRKYLPLKDGEVPSVFRLRRLSFDQLQAARKKTAEEGSAAGACEAIAYGLVSVENFDARVEHKKSVYGERLSKESLEYFARDADLMYELGFTIHRMSGLGPLDE